MAFQMIHMEIAYRLLKRIPPISNPAEFILGSVAPDSVHMNPDYDVNMKVKSHMFEGCGKWSDTQDYQLWKRNCMCQVLVGTFSFFLFDVIACVLFIGRSEIDY